MTMLKPAPYTGNEPYIFISYSHRDSDRVWPIIERLQQDGYRVWYDEGICPGLEWDDFIAAQVEQCSYFIALLSENYLSSENCKDELKYSRDLGKPQLLIYLEDVHLSGGMAMRLNRLQAIFWNHYAVKSEFYNKVYAANGIEIAFSRNSESSKSNTPVNSRGGSSVKGQSADSRLSYSESNELPPDIISAFYLESEACSTRYLQVEKHFYPLQGGSAYSIAADRLSKEPNSIINVGHVVSLLQEYVFGNNHWKQKGTLDAVIFRNKQEAAKRIINAFHGLRSNRLLYPEYIAVLAQNFFVLGYWKQALHYYAELLKQSGVLDAADSASYDAGYAGELDLAAKIIHNMCVILVCDNKLTIANKLYQKYSYIFDLHRQRAQRLDKEIPGYGFQNRHNQLLDYTGNMIFCLDLTLSNFYYSIDGNGMLYAIYQDALKSGEPRKVRMDSLPRIVRLSNEKVALIAENPIVEDDATIIEIYHKDMDPTYE